MFKVPNLQIHNKLNIEKHIKWYYIVSSVTISIDNDVVFAIRSILRVLIYIHICNIYTL